MMKKLLTLLIVVSSLLSLVSCGCEHNWKWATITKPETCTICGEKGKPLDLNGVNFHSLDGCSLILIDGYDENEGYVYADARNGAYTSNVDTYYEFSLENGYFTTKQLNYNVFDEDSSYHHLAKNLDETIEKGTHPYSFVNEKRITVNGESLEITDRVVLKNKTVILSCTQNGYEYMFAIKEQLKTPPTHKKLDKLWESSAGNHYDAKFIFYFK